MCIYLYMSIYIHIHAYIYIYICMYPPYICQISGQVSCKTLFGNPPGLPAKNFPLSDPYEITKL